MTSARIHSIAAVAALASFSAQADTYGANFQDAMQSTRARAEVRAEAAQAVANASFKNFVVANDTVVTRSREDVRAEAVAAAQARSIATGNRS